MKLKDCKIGQRVVVENVDLNSEYCFRLQEIGITEGVSLKVCQNCAFGGKVIAKGAERIGIDAKLANAISVKEALVRIDETR